MPSSKVCWVGSESAPSCISPYRAVHNRSAVQIGCDGLLTLALAHHNRGVLVSRQAEACTGQQLISLQTEHQMAHP